jgi:GAF domain-containing protein
MFANLALHLRRLSSRRIIGLEHIDQARIGKALHFCVRSLPALLDAERCNIFVYDPNAANAWVEIGTGVAEGAFKVPIKSTLIGEVIASGKSLVANDLASPGTVKIGVDRAPTFLSRNAAYAPVRSRYHDEVIGVIEILNKKDGNGFGSADLLVLEEAAENIQDLVDSVFLDQKVYSTTDELVYASAPAILTLAGLMLLSWILTLLLVAAWPAMPVINDAISPSLAPFVPGRAE